MKVRGVALLLSAGVTLFTLVLVPNSASAAPDAAQGGRVTTTTENTVRIQVPMYYSPSNSGALASESNVASTNVVAPSVVVPGNCGRAFLYVSRVAHDEAHLDYGFDNLALHAISYTAQAGGINLDGAGVFSDAASGPLAFRTSFERQVNKVASPANSGEYQVTARLVAYGVTGKCVSAPLLQDVYLY